MLTAKLQVESKFKRQISKSFRRNKNASKTSKTRNSTVDSDLIKKTTFTPLTKKGLGDQFKKMGDTKRRPSKPEAILSKSMNPRNRMKKEAHSPDFDNIQAWQTKVTVDAGSIPYGVVN